MRKQWLKIYNVKRTTFFIKLQNLCLKKIKSKIYQFIHQLEFRLDLTLTRLHFSRNIIHAQDLIKKKNYVTVNYALVGKIYHVLQLKDIIRIYLPQQLNLYRLKETRKKLLNIKYKVKYFRHHRKFDTSKRFRWKFLYRNKFENFMEINYKIFSAIYLRPFLITEIFNIRKRKKNILKKTYSYKKIFKKKKKVLKYKLIKKFWNFN